MKTFELMLNKVKGLNPNPTGSYKQQLNVIDEYCHTFWKTRSLSKCWNHSIKQTTVLVFNRVWMLEIIRIGWWRLWAYAKIVFRLSKTLFNRLKSMGKYRIPINTNTLCKRVQRFSQDICSYTRKGRQKLIKSLKDNVTNGIQK